MGIEPTLFGLEGRCSTIELHPHMTRSACTNAYLVGVTGFEPATSSSRTRRSTKLSHTPIHRENGMVRSARLELAQSKDHYPLKVARLPIPPRPHSSNGMVRVEGLEPPRQRH